MLSHGADQLAPRAAKRRHGPLCVLQSLLDYLSSGSCFSHADGFASAFLLRKDQGSWRRIQIRPSRRAHHRNRNTFLARESEIDESRQFRAMERIKAPKEIAESHASTALPGPSRSSGPRRAPSCSLLTGCAEICPSRLKCCQAGTDYFHLLNRAICVA
jgi:hypothetical protein